MGAFVVLFSRVSPLLCCVCRRVEIRQTAARDSVGTGRAARARSRQTSERQPLYTFVRQGAAVIDAFSARRQIRQEWGEGGQEERKRSPRGRTQQRRSSAKHSKAQHASLRVLDVGAAQDFGHVPPLELAERPDVLDLDLVADVAEILPVVRVHLCPLLNVFASALVLHDAVDGDHARLLHAVRQHGPDPGTHGHRGGGGGVETAGRRPEGGREAASEHGTWVDRGVAGCARREVTGADGDAI